MSDLKQVIYFRQTSPLGPWYECEAGDIGAVAFIRRTQQEATDPAQDLSAAILALPCLGSMSQFASLGDLKLYQEGHKEALEAAAALASSANALSAGDSEDTQFLSWVKAHRQSWLVEYRRRAPESYRAAILQSQKDGHA